VSLLSVEDQFVASMIGNAALLALIGTRLYDRQLPQDAVFPCAVFQRISTNSLQTHGGYDNSRNFTPNLSNSGMTRFQVRVFPDRAVARPADQARQIVQAFSVALQSFNAYDGSNKGPNRTTNNRAEIAPELQPPLPIETFDVFIPYADNT
jgi:hypothetical protein